MTNIWFDNECRRLKTERCRALNKFRKYKDRNSLEAYSVIRRKYQGVCKQKRTEFYRNKQAYIESNIGNSKIFWNELKQLNSSLRGKNSLGQPLP